MLTPEQRLLALRPLLQEAWTKLDDARAIGLSGASVALFERDVERLEHEGDRLLRAIESRPVTRVS